MAVLDIDEEGNESFVFYRDIEEEVGRYELCLVGRLLTEKNINIGAMKTKVVDVWKPSIGISIKRLIRVFFLFQFHHKEGRQWVTKGGP